MRKLKILHIISNFGDGGAQKIVINYAKDFSNDKNVEFSILSFSKKCSPLYKDELEKLNIKLDFLNLPKTNKYQILQRYSNISKELKRYLEESKPDIIHIHLFGTLKLSIRTIKKTNIPLKFYTLHSNPARFKGYRLFILRYAFKKLNFIPICVTEEQAMFAKDFYKFTKYEVVHNGLDIKDIKEKMSAKEKARSELKISEKDYVICAVGRLEKIKRFDLLLKIFEKVLSIKNNAKLYIAGEGVELQNLKSLSYELNIYNNVHFLGNINNIEKLYCASDILAITSESESASLVFLEAQICDLPAIISSGVPNESIISNKVKKMLDDASIEEWANELINPTFDNIPKNNMNEYEVHSISKKMKSIYLKYWKEYMKNE